MKDTSLIVKKVKVLPPTPDSGDRRRLVDASFIEKIKIAIKQKQLLDMFREDERTDAVKNEMDWAVNTFGKKSDGAIWYTRIFRDGLRGTNQYEAKNLEKQKGKLKHYFDSAKAYPTMLKGFTFKKTDRVDQIINHLEKLEEKAKSERKESQKNLKDSEGKWTAVEEGEIFQKINDKWAWWDLKTNYSEAECKAMGHCGRAEEPDSTLLSLREFAFKKKDHNYYYPHLTFEYDEDTETLLQRKGTDNEKPQEKYHKEIIPLLKNKKIKHLDDSYEPETDFKIDDLSEYHLEEIKDKDSLKFKNKLDQSVKDSPDEILEFIKNNTNASQRHRKTTNKLIKIASSKYASTKMLDIMVNDNDEEVRLNVALNKNSSFNAIDKLSKDKNYRIRVAAAKSKNVSTDALESLSKDKHEEVRTQVALNESTPKSILEKLSDDKSKNVKLALIDNDNTTLDILRKLKNDKDSIIRLEADKVLRLKTSCIKNNGSIMDKKKIIAKTLNKLREKEADFDIESDWKNWLSSFAIVLTSAFGGMDEANATAKDLDKYLGNVEKKVETKSKGQVKMDKTFKSLGGDDGKGRFTLKLGPFSIKGAYAGFDGHGAKLVAKLVADKSADKEEIAKWKPLADKALKTIKREGLFELGKSKDKRFNDLNNFTKDF